MKNHTIISFMTLATIATLLAGCNNNNSSVTSYDGRVYDISANKDGRLTAKSEKDGHNYNLTIQGTGDGIDYEGSKFTPWFPITKKIANVSIESGIEYIGNYYFYSISLESIFLPETVVAVGDNTFNPNTVIYSYGSELTNISNTVYYYSATKPTKYGNYFYMENDEVVLWPRTLENPSYLFIGNSYTFRQGSLEDPAVPRYFKNICENLGQNITLDFVVESSYTLGQYADAKDKLGSVVDQKLRTNKYNYVILQDQSTRPIANYEAFETSVKALKEKIDATQTNCDTILYETWGSPGNCSSYGGSVTAMEAKLREAYTKAGKATGCAVNYVGKAFTEAYDVQNINIYADDNRHQSDLGAYFSAAVHARSIYNFKVSECTYFGDFNQEECKSLLEIADRII